MDAILDQIRKMDWIPRSCKTATAQKLDEAMKQIEMQTGKDSFVMKNLPKQLGLIG